MRGFAFFVIVAGALALPVGAEAVACTVVIGADEEAGSPQERAAAEARSRAYYLRQNDGLAHAALTRGLDPAGALATLLVPNVRPVLADDGVCGLIQEWDEASGRESLHDVLAGTRFEDQAEEVLSLSDFTNEEPTFGRLCNAEVRRRFAYLLRARLSADKLRASYLFLATRSDMTIAPSIKRRMMAFGGRDRRPPVRWTLQDRILERQIRDWARRTPDGRALAAIISAFWREQSGKLRDHRRLCPGAVAKWPARQAELVAHLEARMAARKGE